MKNRLYSRSGKTLSLRSGLWQMLGEVFADPTWMRAAGASPTARKELVSFEYFLSSAFSNNFLFW